MRSRSCACAITGTVASFLIVCGSNLVYAGAKPAPLSNESCLDCHDASEHEKSQPYAELLGQSVHTGFTCIECHRTVSALPHADSLPRVHCGDCHSDVADEYLAHGRAPYPTSPDIPGCADCHGRHRILPSTDTVSSTSHAHLAEMCSRCHADIDLLRRHDIRFDSAVGRFSSSVHGAALMAGKSGAPTCLDCHGSQQNPHRVLAARDPQSSIQHVNIPATCGRCHQAELAAYSRGIHGQLVVRGVARAPVCTDCHGEHGIISPKDPRSPVSAARVAEATCTPCHASATLNERYQRSSGGTISWVDSYHGLKSEHGDIAVANCASCHGAHQILPASDSLSTIAPAHLQQTCGQCHPGISATLAGTTVHGSRTAVISPVARAVANIYVVTIWLIVTGMILHAAIDFQKKFRIMQATEQVMRMTPGEVTQHWALLVTFTTLVVTGFALRYADAFWSVFLFGHEGGHPLRGTIHRWAGAGLIAAAGWHLGYLMTSRGRQFLRDMQLRRSDLAQFFQKIRSDLGRSAAPPAFGRFSYIEKFEYWALLWGTAVMAITGLMLWFDNSVVRLVPKWVIETAQVVHFYEAILASLAILVWHLYATVFSPSVYPMNPAWLSGTMPKSMHTHEHGKEARMIATRVTDVEQTEPDPKRDPEE